MLTHNDVTVPNALEVFEGVKDAEVSFFGFKDIGLPFEEMRRLVNTLKGEGRKLVFETVSLTEEGCIRSVDSAINLGVDCFIGGPYREYALEQVRSKGIKYFPYVGRAVGHPCMLRSSIDEVVSDARKAAAWGVDGITLLAYRYNGDVDRLLRSVRSAVDIPLIVAGDINSFERIRSVTELDVWSFTIGSAIFERKFSTSSRLVDQLRAVLAEVERKK